MYLYTFKNTKTLATIYQRFEVFILGLGEYGDEISLHWGFSHNSSARVYRRLGFKGLIQNFQISNPSIGDYDLGFQYNFHTIINI